MPYFTDLFSSRAPTLRQEASNCGPGAQNGAAGNLLSGCYNANRIIDRLEDGFIAEIN